MIPNETKLNMSCSSKLSMKHGSINVILKKYKYWSCSTQPLENSQEGVSKLLAQHPSPYLCVAFLPVADTSHPCYASVLELASQNHLLLPLSDKLKVRKHTVEIEGGTKTQKESSHLPG
jgi:hypothetical protein